MRSTRKVLGFLGVLALTAWLSVAEGRERYRTAAYQDAEEGAELRSEIAEMRSQMNANAIGGYDGGYGGGYGGGCGCGPDVCSCGGHGCDACCCNSCDPCGGCCAQWTGFYVGVTGGVAWSEVKYFEPDDPLEEHRFGMDKEVFGVHVGYNHQLGCTVLGLEADWTDLDLDDTSVAGGGVALRTINFDSLVTLRGRLGYATPCFMAYATAGVAFLQTDLELRITPPGAGAPIVQQNHNLSDTFFVVGAGVEAAITCNLSARIEYLFVNSDLDDIQGLEGFDDGPTFADGISIVRAGVSWRFR